MIAPCLRHYKVVARPILAAACFIGKQVAKCAAAPQPMRYVSMILEESVGPQKSTQSNGLRVFSSANCFSRMTVIL